MFCDFEKAVKLNNQPDLQVHLCLKCHFCPQREENKIINYYIKVILIKKKKVTSEETGLQLDA